MKVKLKWEAHPTERGTYRAKVIGGWLVQDRYFGSDSGGIGLAFVPDNKHEWEWS